ncbi:hypothetical protein ACFFJB_10650 [Camelimonas abortus]|uniref:Uncharacterized protein n=1 Tax=Camelimonas abortus TaxID=1017184 RepID=A0ABV7LF41_9HYPH
MLHKALEWFGFVCAIAGVAWRRRSPKFFSGVNPEKRGVATTPAPRGK